MSRLRPNSPILHVLFEQLGHTFQHPVLSDLHDGFFVGVFLAEVHVVLEEGDRHFFGGFAVDVFALDEDVEGGVLGVVLLIKNNFFLLFSCFERKNSIFTLCYLQLQHCDIKN